MAKDPAFLFYSKDFYEGTRTMLPEERACYVDLMIYQHQNQGYIPNDPKRMTMYCSGVSEATLLATLKAKFKLCEKGWFNQKLQTVAEERQNFSEKQSINGKIGQFFKRAKKDLNAKEYKKFTDAVSTLSTNNKALQENWINIYKTPKAMLQAMLKHLANGDANENVIKDKNEKGGLGEKTSVMEIEVSDPELVLPFESDPFKVQWQHWKVYKQKEFKFKYKSLQSEQAALAELAKLSGGDEKTAIKIIHQSMAKGWKGLFELKENGNGKIGKKLYEPSDDLKRRIAEKMGS